MKKTITFLMLALLFFLTACSSSVEGIYKGSADTTTLNLKDDGTLTYTENKTNSSIDSKGTWEKSGDDITLQIEEIADGDELEATVDSDDVIHIPDQPGWNGELYKKDSK